MSISICKNRIYHFHIRKTGGTSLNEMFYSLNSNDPSDVSETIRQSKSKIILLNGNKYVGANMEELRKSDYFYGFSHFPVHMYKPDINVFTIVIFRDPIERLVSHYNMVVGMISHGIDRPWLNVESRWLGESIVDFAKNMPSEKLLNQLYTFSEEMDVGEAVENVRNVSHIIFNDDYPAGIKSLSIKLGFALEERHSHLALVSSPISKNQKNMLKIMLRKEYEFIEELRREKL